MNPSGSQIERNQFVSPTVPTPDAEVQTAAEILAGYSQDMEDDSSNGNGESSVIHDVKFDVDGKVIDVRVDTAWYDTCPYYNIGEAVAEGYFTASILDVAGSEGIQDQDYVQLGPPLPDGGRVLRFTKREDLTMMRVMGAPPGVSTDIGDVRTDLLRLTPERVDDEVTIGLSSQSDISTTSAPSTPLQGVTWSNVTPLAYAEPSHEHPEEEPGPVDLMRDTTENLDMNGSQEPHIDDYDVVLARYPDGIMPREMRLLRRSPTRRS